MYREARWVVGTLVLLLLAQVALSRPKALVPGGHYLSTQPSGAYLAVSTASSLGGFEVKPLGRSPGPLQLGMDEQSNFTFVISLLGYRTKTVHLTPEQLRAGNVQVALEPVVPLLSPALYLARDYPFLTLSLLLTGAFLLLRVRPKIRHERQLAELLSLDELKPGAELMGYAVKEELGRGGMSRVYRVQPLEGKGSLALKVLRADWTRDARALERFRNEIDLWRGLSHPNIVHLLDWGESSGFVYLVTELVEGKSLDEVPCPSFEQLEDWAEQIVAALAYAHVQGMAHRDVKPANLIVDARGRVFLLDFGIAARLSDEPTGSSGTVGFMPPEQLDGQGGLAVDFYALGCTLYTLAAGRQPFAGDDTVQILARQARSDYPKLAEARPDCPPDLSELVELLMHLQPQQRLTDPEVVLAYLRASRAWRVSAADE